MAGKKYYWIKLKRDFFKRHDIKIVEAMPNGKDYILFYLKLLLESVDHEGELRFNDTIPYNESMLSVITNTNVDIVKAAMAVFIELNMIEMLEDGTIYMTETEKMMGGESASAPRMRKARQAQKALLENNKASHCDTNVQKSDTEIEKEIDIELELESEIEQEQESEAATPPTPAPSPDKPKSNRFKKPTLEEIKQFCTEYGYELDAEYFYDYYEGNGWKVGKNAMKDWRATVRNWVRREKQNSKPASGKHDLFQRLYKEAEENDRKRNG